MHYALLTIFLTFLFVMNITDSQALEKSSKSSGENIRISFKMPKFKTPTFPDRSVYVRDFGAVSDGKTSNTEAFRRAIQRCYNEGGGHVVIPAGIWLTGPIHLKSNIDLHLEKGAELRFSTNKKDYLPVVFTRWEGLECYNWSPLIYANGCTNVAVTGEGKLDGQGKPWWDTRGNKRVAGGQLYDWAFANVPVKDRILGDKLDGLRPSFIQPINCKNVLIEGITLTNGPMWTIHPVYSENVIVRKVKVVTSGPNNDGCNPDSCKNVLIEDCFFSTGDDCIVLKSGLNEDGWRVGRPCENIVVRRCRMERGHGGVVIGSEMSGGVRNLLAYDCEFDGTDTGIRMKSMRGRGGVVENVAFRNIKMKKIRTAIEMTMFYGASSLQPKTQVPPLFKNILIENITCDGTDRAAAITGLPEMPMEGVALENISISGKRGIYAVDVKGLTLSNVDITCEKEPAITLVNNQGSSVRGSRCGDGTEIFVRVDGEKTAGVRLKGNDASKAKVDVSVADVVKAGAVVRE